MKHLNIELIDHMGSDETVANAARVSTNSDRQDKPIEGLIRYLARERHLSPFEHVFITFKITAPLFVRDQWVRHRTQSYNSKSLRYTSITEESITDVFYIPPKKRPLVNVGSGAHPKLVDSNNKDLYGDVVKDMMLTTSYAYGKYQDLLEKGVAEEIARIILPVSTVTQFYATANLRNWSAFVKERTADNAQWEIKQLALDVSNKLEDLYPISWSSLMS